MTTLYHDDIPKSSGIYRITCIVTGKFYIGSALNLSKRWKEHRNDLLNKRHKNPKLQNAWNKHGGDAFTFEILELILIPELLTTREQYYFDTLKPFGHRGYNIAKVAGSGLGIRHSTESRAKISEAHLGKKQSEEHRRKVADAHRGMQRGPETREKLRLAALGHETSEKTREKISIAKKGRKLPPHSAEARGKIRLAHMGHPVSPETREKISAANKGHSHDPEIQASSMKMIIAIAPDGAEHTVRGVGRFCRERGLDPSALMRVAKGDPKFRQHKGWTARLLAPDAS